ncbi:unnamed protein product [Rangifer tarandus platyrhynchus]|uniref:Uncharacterized protein n=1 Tax=Rangifer tarandus platyrhynchus TaxID=3082113 RepID=A0AC59YFZ3_RANTA
MVGAMAVMATSFKKTYASTPQLPGLLESVPLIPWQATVAHTFAGDSQTHTGKSGSVLWGHCSFLLGPGTHKILLCPPRVCFPSPVEILKSNPTGLQSQIPWGFSVSLLNSQVGKSVVGPRTFPTGQEPLSYNCSPVCGSSAQWLYSGANRDILQEDL